MRVLSVASECFPLVKTGGLADVVGALPAALAGEGVQVTTMLPGYPAVLDALVDASVVARLDDIAGEPATLLAGRAAGLDLLVVDAPGRFARDGNPYAGPDGRDWPDNGDRFALLARAAAAVARGGYLGPPPDLVHAHDWQAGLVPACLHYAGGGPPTVFTVHNLAFAGWFAPELLPRTGLPAEAWSIDGVEFFGGVGFLKTGLRFATRITTVSPTYAEEITTPAFGCGLDGLLRARAGDLHGILNGIDTAVWDPARDPLIAQTFSAAAPGPRGENRRALAEAFGIDAAADAPLFGVVSRLSGQKGIDLLVDALPALIATGGSLVVVGTGEPALEAGLRAAAAAHPGRVGVLLGYDEARAHLVQAGSDVLMVPSRFEPCGLTQLCALRYGAVPLVARTGGLADTVIDANPAALAAGVATGLQFAPVEVDPTARAITRAARLFADRGTWARLQANGMATDVSWARPAAAYAALYRSLVPGA